MYSSLQSKQKLSIRLVFTTTTTTTTTSITVKGQWSGF